MQLRHSLTQTNPSESLSQNPWVEQTSLFLTSAQVELRLGLGWIFDLGITSDLPFYQKKNLALINRLSFASLLMAMPGTFMLILMGFSHPFSLLLCGVLVALLVLILNAAHRIELSQLLFAYAPALIITAFTLLELQSAGTIDPLVYLLASQGLCFGLLLPVLVFGFDDRRKVVGILLSCVTIFLFFEVSSFRLGIFQDGGLTGLSSGLFSILSGSQYVGLAACILYVQNYTLQHERECQQSAQKLHHQAIRDGLTGVFNHAFMQGFIADAINRSRRSHTPLALLMIDVDFFKQVNDSFGHNAGDTVLKELVQLLNSSKRSTDYLGRWGGDELLMLLTDTDLAGAVNLAEKLCNLVSGHLFAYCQHLAISLGASAYQDSDSTLSFIERADAAMYRAKHAGRNRVEA